MCGAGVATGQDYNYCDWCNRAFLASAAAKALSLPPDFDIRSYIAKKRAEPGQNQSTLIRDPVLHAYSISQYASQAEAFAAIRFRIKQAAKASGQEIEALLYGNSWGMWGQSPASTLISQRTDIVWSESCSLQELPTWSSLWGPRPEMNAWSILWYKMGLAAGGHEKPVWLFANDVNNPALAELWQAEGIANGGLSVMLHVDMFTPYNASRGFSQGNMRQAKFVTSASNRWLFVDRRSVAETAIVVSLPSLLWRDFSSLTLDFDTAAYDESHMNYYSVAARLLADRHVPFDVILLGLSASLCVSLCLSVSLSLSVCLSLSQAWL